MEKLAGQLSQAKGLVAGAFSSGFAQLVGAAGIAGIMGLALKKASDAEEGQVKLKSALEATGQNVVSETERINKMAAAVSNATAMSKGHIKEIATVGINLGLTGDQTTNYTKAAIGLAKVTNGDASEAMRALVKAGDGNITMLQRQLPQLQHITDHTKFMAAAMKLAQQGMHQQEATANTLEGKWAKLQQAVSKILTTLGQLLLPIVEAVVEGLTDMIGSVNTNSDATESWGKTITGVCGWIKNAFAEVRWQWSELGNTFAIVGTYVAEGFTRLYDIIRNTFSNAVEIVRWFFDNWKSIFSDIGNFASTVFSNLADNIINAVKRAWNWITGSKEPNTAFKNLADGFISQTKQMPQLKNILEKGDLTKSLEEQRHALEGLRERDSVKYHQNELARIQARTDKEKSDHEEANNMHLDVLGKSKGDSKKEGGFTDLLTAWKNMQSAAIKKDQTPEKQLAIAKDQHGELKQINKNLEKIANGKGKMIAVAG